jgi:putative PLP-dependent aminotransferase (TIGR04422 family)
MEQWPIPQNIVSKIQTFSKNDDAPKAIEEFFELIMQKPVLLFPSARSAISFILKFENINRMHSAFAPKWSSHCVWNVLSKYTNPTFHTSPCADVSVIVHKWGHQFTKSRDTGIVIEDSVDSIIIDPKALFPNHGKYEVFSLPKIIASYAGGLLVVKDNLTKDKLKSFKEKLQSTNYEKIAKLKRESAIDPSKNIVWSAMELENYQLTKNCLLNILANLTTYLLNAEICHSRMSFLNKHSTNLITNKAQDAGRLPCNAIFPLSKSTKKLPQYHFNTSFKYDTDQFTKVATLPLHFQIGDEEFHQMALLLK